MIIESVFGVVVLDKILETVVEDSIGETGHDLIQKFVVGVIKELSDPKKRKANRAIAYTVRSAQLGAMEAALGGYAIVINQPDRMLDPFTQTFLENAATFCRSARRQLKTEEGSLEFSSNEVLSAAIEGLLSSQPRFSPAGKLAATIGAFAVDAVIDELTNALAPLPVPDSLTFYLRNGAGDGHPQFLDLFGAEISACLSDKNNTAFRDSLQTPPRCLGWVAAPLLRPQQMFFSSAERRFSVPA